MGSRRFLSRVGGCPRGLLQTTGDTPQANISKYFTLVSDFLETALESGGSVLVHCLMGMSRSATCVLAFLCIKRNMSAVEAVMKVKEARDVRPNDGFLIQLSRLDLKL